MIDLEPFIGSTTWRAVEYISPYTGQTASMPLPDLDSCFRFIILCLIIYFLIRSIFGVVRLFG